VWRRPAHRADHVAPEDQDANVLEPASREAIVDTGRATLAAEQLLERARVEDPFVQREAADTEWILEALARSRAVAVDRQRKAVDSELRHGGVSSAFLRRCPARGSARWPGRRADRPGRTAAALRPRSPGLHPSAPGSGV